MAIQCQIEGTSKLLWIPLHSIIHQLHHHSLTPSSRDARREQERQNLQEFADDHELPNPPPLSRNPNKN